MTPSERAKANRKEREKRRKWQESTSQSKRRKREMSISAPWAYDPIDSPKSRAKRAVEEVKATPKGKSPSKVTKPAAYSGKPVTTAGSGSGTTEKAPAKTSAPPKPAASSGSGTKGKTRVPYVAGIRRSPSTGKASPGKSTRSPTQKQMLAEQMKGLEGSGSKPKKKSTVKKAAPKVVAKKAAPKAVAKKTAGSRGTKKSVTLLTPAQAKQRKDELMKKAVAAGRKKSAAKKKRSRLKPTKTGYASYKSFMGK
jgi:hypothetical protein